MYSEPAVRHTEGCAVRRLQLDIAEGAGAVLVNNPLREPFAAAEDDGGCRGICGVRGRAGALAGGQYES